VRCCCVGVPGGGHVTSRVVVRMPCVLVACACMLAAQLPLSMSAKRTGLAVFRLTKRVASSSDVRETL
jgi:hypothetical protein